jgi:hypothetical protein
MHSKLSLVDVYLMHIASIWIAEKLSGIVENKVESILYNLFGSIHIYFYINYYFTPIVGYTLTP